MWYNKYSSKYLQQYQNVYFKTFWRGCINLQTLNGGKKMAISILKETHIGIPRTLEWKCKDGDVIYVMQEYASYAIYITKVAPHLYIDRDGINRSDTLLCKSVIEKRKIRLTEDVSYLFQSGKNATSKVQVIKGYTDEHEEVLYLRPFNG